MLRWHTMKGTSNSPSRRPRRSKLSRGRAVGTGAAYANRYISVLKSVERKVTRWRDYLDPIVGLRIRGVAGWNGRLTYIRHMTSAGQALWGASIRR